MLISCLFVIIGLALLMYGADVFVAGAASIARLSGMSPMVIGLTVVGFATSAPEIIVGSLSAWQGKTAIAIGNALGSNITNIGLVLGLSVIIIPIKVASAKLKREYGLMLAAIGIGLIIMLDGELCRLDGMILFIALIIAIGWIVWIASRSSEGDPLMDEFSHELQHTDSGRKATIKLFIGLALLLGGAHLLISAAVAIAVSFGVSELVIGLTIVAIGTSLPELAASITSLMKNEADIAIGNIIGSNMFNMLAVLGIPAMIQPTVFELQVLTRDFTVMSVLSILLGIMIFTFSRGRLMRLEGLTLVVCFIAYQILLYVQTINPAAL